MRQMSKGHKPTFSANRLFNQHETTHTKWGINLLGKFPKANAFEHIIIAIDYFNKLLKAKQLKIISRSQVKKNHCRIHHISFWNSQAHNIR